ncbi:hypothetical protein BB559_006100 [Furculomyces boomerangus]|uniref:Uncharacterized protein n=1 Tax=Furculomyces boomerangus TaxID=61424 RepID=A0A2T9Y4Q0_9FUNG|nr:hypothetical protein BB559_006100 [Furculomyces boomerangus]
MIMKEIEKKLNLEPGTFKNPENKKQLKEIVDDILETLADQDNENEPTEDISNRIVEEPQRELLKPNKELIAKTKKKRTKTKPKTEIIHNDMGDDSDFDTRPQKSVKTEKKNMKKDLIESKEEEEPTKFEEKTTLKSYVNRCGVRKPWTKVFAGKTPKHQISYLKDTLKSLGMEGRPSLAKCDQIKAKRELEQEMEDIDPKNIIDEEADKKILKPRKRIEKKKQELESEVENADQEELEDQEDSESSDEYSKSENDESTESVEEKRPEKIKRSRVALSDSE